MSKVNAQWREAIKKEMNNHSLNEHFDFNPKNRKYRQSLPPARSLTYLTIFHEVCESTRKILPLE